MTLHLNSHKRFARRLQAVGILILCGLALNGLCDALCWLDRAADVCRW